MKLNLGSGKRNLEGFINIDAVKQTDTTTIGDILNLNYKDNSIDEIYSEHVIEHLTKIELNRYFTEANRMLVSGGRFNLIAPSMVSAIDLYLKDIENIDWLDSFLFANHIHEFDFHKQGIYKEKLFRLCKENGFNVISCEFQDREFSICEIKLEAIKT